MRSQAEKAAAFQALHERPGVFVMPNPWDAGSARMLDSLGFEALATTSMGMSNSLGCPDGSGAVSRERVVAHCRTVVEATDLPVSADLENCYAHEPDAAAEMIALAADAGVVGGSIEDGTGSPDSPIYDFGHAVERVRAAVETARKQEFGPGPDGRPTRFLLTARAENFVHGRPDLHDTIRRLQAYEEAGADVLFAPGLTDLDSIRAVVSSVGKPLSVVVTTLNDTFTVEALAAAGVRRVSTGAALYRLAMASFLRGARELRDGGLSWLPDMAPGAELNGIFKRFQ